MSVTGTSVFTITAAPREDTLYQTPNKSFRLKIVLASFTSRIGYIAFTVTVNRYTCISSTVYTQVGSLVSPFAYTVGSGPTSFTASSYTTSPYTCAETVTYSLTNPSGTVPD
jgi:hypothetical protein